MARTFVIQQFMKRFPDKAWEEAPAGLQKKSLNRKAVHQYDTVRVPVSADFVERRSAGLIGILRAVILCGIADQNRVDDRCIQLNVKAARLIPDCLIGPVCQFSLPLH